MNETASHSQDRNDRPLKGWLSFFRIPTTFLEWFVIGCVLLVIAALLLMPNIDEGSSEAKRQHGTHNADNEAKRGAVEMERAKSP